MPNHEPHSVLSPGSKPDMSSSTSSPANPNSSAPKISSSFMSTDFQPWEVDQGLEPFLDFVSSFWCCSCWSSSSVAATAAAVFAAAGCFLQYKTHMQHKVAAEHHWALRSVQMTAHAQSSYSTTATATYVLYGLTSVPAVAAATAGGQSSRPLSGINAVHSDCQANDWTCWYSLLP